MPQTKKEEKNKEKQQQVNPNDKIAVEINIDE